MKHQTVLSCSVKCIYYYFKSICYQFLHYCFNQIYCGNIEENIVSKKILLKHIYFADKTNYFINSMIHIIELNLYEAKSEHYFIVTRILTFDSKA